MNPYLAVFSGDLKQVKRDPTLLMLFLIPLFMLVFVRYGIPYVETLAPELKDYYAAIVAFFCIMNANFPGFIVAFILLDEKDLQLFPVIKTQPISMSGFLKVRLAFIVVFGFLSSLLIALFNGLIVFSMIQNIAIALLSALTVPILVLIVSFKAKNKVEGMTLLKVVNVTIIAPAAIFFINSPMEYLFGIFPAFWVYKIVALQNNELILLNVVLGIIYLSVTTYFVFRRVLKI